MQSKILTTHGALFIPYLGKLALLPKEWVFIIISTEDELIFFQIISPICYNHTKYMFSYLLASPVTPWLVSSANLIPKGSIIQSLMKILNSTGNRFKSLQNFILISFYFVSEPLITTLWVQFSHMFHHLPTMTLSGPPLFRKPSSLSKVFPKLFVYSHVYTSFK